MGVINEYGKVATFVGELERKTEVILEILKDVTDIQKGTELPARWIMK